MLLTQRINRLRGQLVSSIGMIAYNGMLGHAWELERELRELKARRRWVPPGTNMLMAMGAMGLEIWQDGELKLTISDIGSSL